MYELNAISYKSSVRIHDSLLTGQCKSLGRFCACRTFSRLASETPVNIAK